jgi:hypothetical protein
MRRVLVRRRDRAAETPRPPSSSVASQLRDVTAPTAFPLSSLAKIRITEDYPPSPPAVSDGPEEGGRAFDRVEDEEPAKRRPAELQGAFVNDEQQRLLEIEEMRLVVKFGDKKR